MTPKDFEYCSRFLKGACLRDLLEEYAIRRGTNPEMALKAYATVFKSLFYVPRAIADKTFRYRKLFANKPAKQVTKEIVLEVSKDESIDFSTALKRSAEALGLPEGLLQGLVDQFLVSCESLAGYFDDPDRLMARFGVDPEGGYLDYYRRNYETGELTYESFEGVLSRLMKD